MPSFETLSACPVCSSTQFTPFLTCTDYLVSQRPFAIVSCSACGFRLTNPRPDAQSIGAYYKSVDYVSHNDSGGGVINRVYRAVRSYTLRSKLTLINSLTGGTGSLLDVGCGTGAFLETCKRVGWQTTGMEPDPDARAIATEKTGNLIFPEMASVPVDQGFDVITMWHVLEHVPNLPETIGQLHARLKAGGTLIVAVPNSNSYDAQYFGAQWAAYDVPRHLSHFTPETIERLFNNNGFRLVGQKPMVFDAFYIGLLSTAYQKGKSDYVTSMRVGLQSNNRARQTGNWSSVIYLFRKA